jgi:enoyl-CoA hydratase/carnithine racemase
MRDFEHLIVEKHGRVGWLIFNRPEAYNAMNLGLMDELPEAWAELDRDEEVRVIVNTGEGKGFCTGVDLKELADDPRGMTVHAERVRTNKLTLSSLHNDVWKPVICAVNGVCAGGGLHFVIDADIVIAASDAAFLDPHVSVGQVSTYEPIGLRARMPFEAVARMLLVGRYERLTAERAYELGLVSQVVDPPDALRDEAQRLGEMIARNSPSAMMASKKALWESLDLGLTEAFTRGAQALADFWRHPDNAEGPVAFVENREPRWAPPTRNV